MLHFFEDPNEVCSSDGGSFENISAKLRIFLKNLKECFILQSQHLNHVLVCVSIIHLLGFLHVGNETPLTLEIE